ncbi:glutamate formimidoyltransferase [Phaeodactylibacter sp.]|uniref:glutamate formimidoyltransferase n=1 Tax=Phaeodactylibacter sp. TaxID=1940289 RepID=UPI0025E8C0B7|nr:glutamate formimidoyltransferase [Phaeodactylibacter sp.]MCI4651610.1 glutamate formimidoyltransferase [Phaeodactylibacter sp.]MCI5090735.1 glutamate formimidoyltransferase [Phaeodactylibacter sp.]
MQNQPLIECVPNFSEGRDPAVLKQITDAIEAVEGVKLLDVDPGKATNRTVVTFVGAPEPVIEAAFQAMKKASEVIDMSKHTGEHPRMGATDVCPLIPIAHITMEEVAKWAHKLARRVGEELGIPIYMYESAATKPAWRNLATVRSGEYEALPDKLAKPEWKPDYGPAKFNATAGATAVGARDFLIAYNVNLNTTSVRRANSVAFDVREQGRLKREGGKVSGAVLKDENGNALREPGKCKGVKGIGWYIEEYGIAQISMNITDVRQTPLHIAFEACRESANRRGMRVTGSELVGLVPLQVMLDAGHYFLQQQRRSLGASEEEVIKIAVKSMGLDELSPFDPQQKIIEYQLAEDTPTPLLNMNLRTFSNETASESVAPGGGSVAAYVGALGASLGTMVANLSSHRRVWDDRWAEFSEWAERGQRIKDGLLALVDEDTRSFNGIIAAVRMPKGTEAEKAARHEAMQEATKYATEVPFRTMELALETFEVCKAMAEKGNPNSASDAGVGALCARAAVHGAWLNVRINAGDIEDKAWVEAKLSAAQSIAARADALEQEVIGLVERHVG